MSYRCSLGLPVKTTGRSKNVSGWGKRQAPKSGTKISFENGHLIVSPKVADDADIAGSEAVSVVAE